MPEEQIRQRRSQIGRNLFDPTRMNSPGPESRSRVARALAWRYVLAVGVAAAAVAIRWAMVPVFGYQTPYFIVYPAVMVIAVLWGVGPAIAASLVCFGGTETLLVQPYGRLHLAGVDLIRLGVLFFPALYLGWVGRRLREARTGAEAQTDALRLAQQAAGAGTWDWDTTMGKITWSPELFAIFGLDPNKNTASFETWESILHPDDKAGAAAKIETALKNRIPLDSEYRIITPDGEMRWIWSTGEGTYDANCRPVRMIGICQNITDRKRAEERTRLSEEQHRRLVQHLHAGVVVHDAETHILLANLQACTMLGLTHEQMMGKAAIDPAWCFVREDQTPMPLEEYPVNRVLSSREPLRDQVLGINHADGRRTWVLVNAFPGFDPAGAISQVVVTFIDITERKQAEEALQQAKDELELRVHERTAELTEAVAELKRSNRDLEQFAYVSSHDLQEPLRMVTSFVQLLADRYKDKVDEDGKKFISFAVEGALRMRTLINDLLAYSRVNSRAQPFQPTDCEALLKDVLQGLALRIEETGAEVTHDSLPTVSGDRTQLAQVFQNLIGNAIKFRSEKPPCVHIGVERRDTEWIFSVRDNGIGIPPECHEKIFIIFQRLHTRRYYEGNGIGLAIVKRIVERHGGTIRLDSKPGEGSTFYFTINTNGGGG